MRVMLVLFLILPGFAWARDLSVVWDNPDSVGTVEYFEVRYRNPTEWNEAVIRNRLSEGNEVGTSRYYLIRDAQPGTVEVNVRSCSDSVNYRSGGACISGLVDGWTTGCCSDWTALFGTLPSQPVTPVITP
jgi:hypothetical protein